MVSKTAPTATKSAATAAKQSSTAQAAVNVAAPVVAPVTAAAAESAVVAPSATSSTDAPGPNYVKCNRCIRYISKDAGQQIRFGGLCNECNRLATRMTRLLADTPEQLKAYKEMSRERKATFFKDNHQKFGSDLQAALEQVIEEKIEETHVASMEGTGEWLDEDDLALAFKDKPKQFEAIKRNSKPMYDPIREVYLWQKMAFVSRTTDSSKYSSTEKSSVEATRIRKKESAPKKPKTVCPDGDKQKVEKALTPSQIQKLQKLIETMTKLSAGVVETSDNVVKDEYAKYVAPILANKIELAKTELSSQLASLEIVLEAGQCKENVATIMAPAQAIQKEAGDLKKEIDKQMGTTVKKEKKKESE